MKEFLYLHLVLNNGYLLLFGSLLFGIGVKGVIDRFFSYSSQYDVDAQWSDKIDETQIGEELKFPQKSGQGVKQVSIFQSYLDCDSPSMNAA